jgi:hypothetical protein
LFLTVELSAKIARLNVLFARLMFTFRATDAWLGYTVPVPIADRDARFKTQYP